MFSRKLEIEESLKDFKWPLYISAFLPCEDGFSGEVRLKVEYTKDISYSSVASEFISFFAGVTSTDCIVRTSKPCAVRFLFSKTYVCQHSSFKKTHRNDYKLQPRSRDKSCLAEIVFKVKKDTPDTRKHDSFIKNGYTTAITIEFIHNHLVKVAAAFGFLRPSPEIKLQFSHYFEQGLTAAPAKNFHEVKLLPDDVSGLTTSQLLANARLNHTIRAVNYMLENYGARDPTSVLESLKKRKLDYEEKGITVLVNESTSTVAILTGIMKRAHHSHFSSEVVFVDSSSSCDHTSRTVTFLFGASKIGAIPLGCVFYGNTDEYSTEAFNLISMNSKLIISFWILLVILYCCC